MEVTATKKPTTINVDERAWSFVQDEIKDSKFMYLSGVRNEDLFMFAFALGWNCKLSAEFEKVHSGGFCRTEAFSSRLSAMIDLTRFSAVGFEHPNALRDHRGSYEVAERYANAGFRILEDEVRASSDSEKYANDLIAEMDEMYEGFAKKYDMMPL